MERHCSEQAAHQSERDQRSPPEAPLSSLIRETVSCIEWIILFVHHFYTLIIVFVITARKVEIQLSSGGRRRLALLRDGLSSSCAIL